MHNTFRYGQGTRDMTWPDGLTTEAFIEKVGWRLGRYLDDQVENITPPKLEEPQRSNYDNVQEYFPIIFVVDLGIYPVTVRTQIIIPKWVSKSVTSARHHATLAMEWCS